MTTAALAMIHRKDRWFLQRRDLANPMFPGLWEFPGGKAQADETPLQVLERELWEEVGCRVRKAKAWPAMEGRVTLLPFVVESEDEPCTALGWGWFTVGEMLRLPLPPRNRALVEGLRNLGSCELI
jgi:8-oxo-dGTP pyrophosphatase MutT (NUDIX family)